MKQLQATLSPKVALRPSDTPGRARQGHRCLCRDLKRDSILNRRNTSCNSSLHPSGDGALRPHFSVRAGRLFQSRSAWQRWCGLCPKRLATHWNCVMCSPQPSALQFFHSFSHQKMQVTQKGPPVPIHAVNLGAADLR